MLNHDTDSVKYKAKDRMTLRVLDKVLNGVLMEHNREVEPLLRISLLSIHLPLLSKINSNSHSCSTVSPVQIMEKDSSR